MQTDLVHVAASLAGLGNSREGFGVISPGGNADWIKASGPGGYEVTGVQVNVRSTPDTTTARNIVGSVNGGPDWPRPADIFEADGGSAKDSRGIWFASGNRKGVTESVWVAQEYLAPPGTFKPAAAPPPAPPPKEPEKKKLPLAMMPAKDYTVPVLIGAGVLGVGLIGYAVVRARRRKKAPRTA